MERQCRTYLNYSRVLFIIFPLVLLIYIFFFLKNVCVGFLQSQLVKTDIQIRPLTPAAYRSRARSAQEVDDLEENLKEYEGRVSQMNSSHESLQRRYLQLTELRHVLRESSSFFDEVNIYSNNNRKQILIYIYIKKIG